MRKCPVLAARCDLVRRVVNRDDASARERSEIRFSLLVERDIPCSKRSRPVVEDAVELIRPLRVIGLIVRLVDVGATLGPVGILCWKSIVHTRHRRWLADISVPGDSI